MTLHLSQEDLLEKMMDSLEFTPEEEAVIREYQAPSIFGKAGEINEALYHSDKYCNPETKRRIDVLTDACQKGKLTFGLEVLRGEDDYYGIRNSDNDDKWIGEVLDKKGFMSTSLCRAHSRALLFRIKVPAGAHAIYIKRFAENETSGDFEKELLIQRGYKLRIDHIDRDKSNYPTIYADLLLN